jgi:hypothetical protein
MTDVANQIKANQNKDISQTTMVAKARIDSKAEFIEPIDYSFRDLMNFSGFFFLKKRENVLNFNHK